MGGLKMQSLRGWLVEGRPRGVARADLLAPALLRCELTEAETSAVVGALRVRAGHSVADPVPDDDIRRVVQALVYEGADEAEVYRVREAMRRAGDRVTSHT
ncbi:MAG: DUF3349 domain-containing protein [Actinomycetales bacterium]|uniref:DUF3349 domain-containing protein n=1 Tax=Candidatus Phosphoribacter hodrii TaxID=2953743 RepID=A0A935CCJ8_9MICO|nr:DUF3349 domain-containing protein [Candidatus Phosphoribacter hodrii]MBP8838461.1 DUF3349 domain-containing protein [Dermatophilaceae bacterium]MBK7273435.1 DUF3349 domain-containing protein [Candidatus Phosphoribacter hodrii]MBL0005465.1 DUF3349 domain-containing protein [Candidatus Phosphoribacter hodrii]HNV13600.1 DUF3349 domain-containing protein [Dermatophilaceae bacterium]